MAQPDRRLLALSVRSTSPGQRFRIQQWASFLSAEGIETVEHAFASPALERVLDSQDELGVKLRETARSWATYGRHFPALSQMDAALIFREAVPIGPDLALRRLRGWEGPIAFDVDDPIFLGPGGDTSAAMRAIRPHNKWQRLCRMSQVTLAINRPIAEVLSEFSERVEVVPNVIDLDRYPALESQSNGRVPVIGFSGSPSTMAVMKEIEEPLRELARENQFVLHVIGGPSAVRPEGVEVRELRWSSAQEAALLSDLDIGLAPAPDDEWNRFKFPVKILLYMAAGRPVVASPVGSAREVIRDGENGFLASTPDEWLERLRYLLDDPDTRARLGQEARRTVEQEYSLSALKPHVARIFTDLVGR